MKKTCTKLIILTLLLYFQFGCTPAVKVTSFAPIPPSKKKDKIDVYTSAANIKKQYKEVALITVDDQGWGMDESELTRVLIDKAKMIGADGVIILGKDEQFEGAFPVSGILFAISSKVVKGTAIIYTEPEDRGEESQKSEEVPYYGTGFLVSNDGYLFTNTHVIRNASKIVVSVEGVEYIATLIKADYINDIAVLKVQGEFSSLLIGDSSKVALGESVFTIGFPNIEIQGTSPKLTDGVISSLNGFKDDPRVFQISVPLQPGNSGSPLMLKSGEVIGIITSSLSDLGMLAVSGKVPQNVNYAIKINYAKILLETSDIAINSSQVLENADFQTVIEKVKKATAVIYRK